MAGSSDQVGAGDSATAVLKKTRERPVITCSALELDVVGSKTVTLVGPGVTLKIDRSIWRRNELFELAQASSQYQLRLRFLEDEE